MIMSSEHAIDGDDRQESFSYSLNEFSFRSLLERRKERKNEERTYLRRNEGAEFGNEFMKT